MSQEIRLNNPIENITQLLAETGTKKFLLVHDDAFPYLGLEGTLDTIGIPYICFRDFTPNPLYEDVCNGVSLFNRERCDAVVAVGGGSTIDVAKCIKLFCHMNPQINYLEQQITDNGVPLIAVPTTAGTGSESTRYAVIYFEGEKQSISDNSILPDYVILEPALLKTLPVYQKKCTLLDALCQGIESWWSVNSTEESRKYSKLALQAILSNWEGYIFENSAAAAREIMIASNYAGKAINITQTTAAHAMSYKLTSLYHLPHGYAVALCLPHVWRYMFDNISKCKDTRGREYLSGTFADISYAIGADSVETAIGFFEDILCKMELSAIVPGDQQDLRILAESVNTVRLKNNPVTLTTQDLYDLYQQIILIGRTPKTWS